MTDIPNDCPEGSTCSSKRARELALEVTGSSHVSAMEQLWESGRQPSSFQFVFSLLEVINIPLSWGWTMLYVQIIDQINKTQNSATIIIK